MRTVTFLITVRSPEVVIRTAIIPPKCSRHGSSIRDVEIACTISVIRIVESTLSTRLDRRLLHLCVGTFVRTCVTLSHRWDSDSTLMYVLASTKELVPSENSGENVALEIFNQPRQVWIVLVELVKFGRRNTGETLLADRVLGLLLLEVDGTYNVCTDCI